MEERNDFTKVLAIAGTLLVWFPILAPIILSTALFIAEHRFRFDYLMPMELFLFALGGSGLLLWATLRAHAQVKSIVWGIGIAIVMFVGVQWFAQITGLASGEAEPTGWRWDLAIMFLIVFVLGIVVVGMNGAILVKDLFKRRLTAI